MKLRKIVGLFLSFVLLGNSLSAFETDQFNLPPQPLADIGDEVSDYVGENLRRAVEKLNAEIKLREACLANDRKKSAECASARETKARLAYLRSDDAAAREVFKLLGTGIIPFTKSGTWMEKHQFKAQPARYKTGFSESIFSVFPTNYLTISQTVKIYDAEFGTDKIAHFFQQGYDYFKIYRRAINENLTPEKAAQKAVRWGQKTERTYYGTLVSGVYSNADLCANFAGMRFYQNLTRAARIGETIKPAVLQIENGVWTFTEHENLQNILLKPFVSRHFSEAFNPSIYSNLFTLRRNVRRTLKRRACRQWLDQNPKPEKDDLEAMTQALKIWHGEDYGFTDSRYFVTIADTCFDNQNEIETSE